MDKDACLCLEAAVDSAKPIKSNILADAVYHTRIENEDFLEPSSLEIGVGGSVSIWHNLIFIPFNSVFGLLTITSVIVVISLVVYQVAYNTFGEWGSMLSWTLCACELIYLMDVVLRKMHSMLPNIRETREYIVTPWPALVIDIMSLIPIHFLYDVMILDKSTHWKGLTNVLHMNKMLRIYRLPMYFSHLRSSIGTRQLYHVILGYTIMSLVFVHIFAAVLHLMGCWYCEEMNWTHSFTADEFQAGNNHSEFLAACTVVLALSWHNAKGNISATTPKEWSYLCIIMILGFFIKYTFYGFLVTVFRRNMERQLSFILETKSEAEFVENWGASNSLREELDKYYVTLLENRAAIKETPHFFESLPEPLKRSVTLDLHWEALRHSHLFRDESIAMKRALSSLMSVQFLLPGDYVFKMNRYTARMIYISAGVLQVIAEDDAETPVLSLSNGTVLGEGTLLMPSNCRADVRCATHTKIHTLDAVKLYKLLNLYPALSAKLHHTRMARIIFAKNLKYLRYKHIGPDQNMEHIYGISWLKTQWRVLIKEALRVEKTDAPIFLPLTSIDGARTSRHLDLLVLSDEVELITNAVCLQMNCPWVLEPESNFLIWWNNIIVIISFLTVVLYPYYIAFIPSFPIWLLVLDNITNTICAIDIYLQISTAAKVQENLMVIDILGIIKLRFQRLSFIIDIIATMPMELFIMATGIGVDYTYSIYRINKLLRIIRLYNFMIIVENDLAIRFHITRMWKAIFTYFLASYWFATTMYATACSSIEHECEQTAWIGYFGDREKSCFEYPLIITMYYASNTLGSLGLTLFVPISDIDLLINNTMVVLGLLLYFYFCGELGATYIIQNQKKHAATETLLLITHFLEIHGSSTDIISRVHDHLCTQWLYNKFGNVIQGKLLNLASNDLHDKIIIKSIMKTLRAIPLFFMADDAILEAMANKATVFLLTGDTKIGRIGHKPTAIYIIRNGYCQVVSGLPADVERERTGIAGPGSLMLLTEFFYHTFVMADIYTITTCEIISIQHSDFWETLNRFPLDKEELQTVIQFFIMTVKDVMISISYDKDREKETLKVVAVDEDVSLAQYLEPFKRIGRISMIRYLMLVHGISPHGKVIAKWELFREIICFLSSIFYPQFFTTYVRYPKVRYIGYALDIVGFVDIYLRLHICYYNRYGIFVTHPLWTAKHYLGNGFLVDVITTVPLELLGLGGVLGKQNEHLTTAWYYLITRPLLIFRIFGRYTSMGNDITESNKLFSNYKYFLTIIVMLNALSCANMLYICDFIYNEHHQFEEMRCSRESWLITSRLASYSYDDPVTIFCMSMYYYTSFMFRCGNSLFTAATTTGMMIVMLISMTVIPAWWMIIAQLSSHKVGGDLTITVHREDMKAFITYLKNEDVPSNMISQTIAEIEYRWRCSQGVEWKKLLGNLPSQLYEEVAFELHGSALDAGDLFHEKDSSAIRLLSREVNEVYYRKGTPIIDRNEVQNKIYFVKSGLVEILAADNSLICTLEKGGIFGAFKRRMSVRHTMKIIAHVHVVLLVISVDDFFRILDNFPNVLVRLARATLFDAEFVDQIDTYTKDYDRSELAALSLSSRLQSLIFIPENSSWYQCYQYLLCIPISILSVYLVTTQIALQSLHPTLNAIIYASDFLFMVKIFLGFHTTFIDESSGILVDNYVTIASRYFKTIKLFWMDLFSCIPFEVFAYCAVNHTLRARLLTTLKINRLLRLLHIYYYHKQNYTKLDVQPMRRWIFHCSTFLMYIHLGICLWILVACSKTGCSHRLPPDKQASIVTSRIHVMQLAYLYNFDLLTTVGSHDVRPESLLELMTTIFLILLYQLMATNFLTTIVAIIHFAQHSFANYEKQAMRLHSFLKSRSLSPVLLDRVWQYLLQRWVRQRGPWMPNMILESPSFLRQQIMFEIYGYLLMGSPVFSGLHEDFLYQLAARMERCVYFPKNFLAESGDIDHTMYFIHTGQVKVQMPDGTSSIRGPGSILGIRQGMVTALPHLYSVMAVTITDVLTLYRDAWSDLLVGFPAVKIILNRRIHSLPEDF